MLHNTEIYYDEFTFEVDGKEYHVHGLKVSAMILEEPDTKPDTTSFDVDVNGVSCEDPDGLRRVDIFHLANNSFQIDRDLCDKYQAGE